MGLLILRDMDLSHDFKIDNENYFYSPRWNIQVDQTESFAINFSRLNTHGNDKNFEDLITLVRMLTYYSFPNKVNLSIKSWYTTAKKYSDIVSFSNKYLIKYSLISIKLIKIFDVIAFNKEIELLISKIKRKERGAATILRQLVSTIDHWSLLSEKEYLPEEYCLRIKREHIISQKKRKEITHLLDSELNTWSPIEGHVIEQAYKHAKKYIHQYSESIIRCHEIIRNRPRKRNNHLAQVRKDGMTKNIFIELANIHAPEKTNGKKLFNLEVTTKKVKSLGYKSGWQDRTQININGVRREVIELKRSCLFIICLFTGLRRREIANLRANPAYKKNGDTYLDIVRFKTSDDPNHKGEQDSIPVPPIVADAVNCLLLLFKDQRISLNSDYLITVDYVTRKDFEKVQIKTVTNDIKHFILSATGYDLAHPHRLRKTIAWLLISRGEKNLELIRQLFGHKSFGMTLRYVLRNHLMVGSVIELLEHNYTNDLNKIFNDIETGNASGVLSQRIKERMNTRKFKGQLFVTNLEVFIYQCLSSGIPLFISMIPIGGFCLKVGESKKIPQCMIRSGGAKPDVDFCDYKNCEHVIYDDVALKNINAQIKYFQVKLSYLTDSSNKNLVGFYEREIMEHKNLLYRLQQRKDDNGQIFESTRY
ncbi:TPA: tyrosine-type recombinase/integrase [Vibrio cholerae]